MEEKQVSSEVLSKKLDVNGNIRMEYDQKGRGIVVGKDFLISAEAGKIVINKGDKNNGWKNVVIPKGKVGIGTSKPGSILEVNSLQSASGMLRIRNSSIETDDKENEISKESSMAFFSSQNATSPWMVGSGVWNQIDKFVIGRSSPKLIIEPNGNVGIGTNSPSKKLHVDGDVKIEGKLTLNEINGKVKVLSSGSAYGMIQVRNSSDTSDEVSIGFFPSNGAEAKDAWVVGVGAWGHTDKFVIGHRGGGINSASPRLVIDSNGCVGIGETSPSGKAKLVIKGSSASFVTNKKHGWVMAKGPGKSNSQVNPYRYSIYVDNDILCNTIRAFSDKRIKTISGVSNSQNDLETLSKIEITDYQHIDVIGKGAEPHKKVIAQQVKTVFPQCVSADIEDFIPSIYTKTEIKEGWIVLAADVNIHDRVKLIFSDGIKEVKVLEKLDGMFKVDTDKEGEVFVYGKEVSDFHTVDYDAISMLNVSATQELLKRLEDLEQEVKNLKNKEQ